MAPRPAPPDDRALRVQVARAEARRAAGVAELVELAHGSDAHARALALRGLGRIGALDALGTIAGSDDAKCGAVLLAYTLDEQQAPDEAQGCTLSRFWDLAGPSPERAALELGRRSKHGVPLDAQQRATLVEWTRSPEPRVRYAASFALAKEHAPPDDAAVTAALAARVADDDPEIRAVAIAGLAHRKAIDAARPAIAAALADRDWRVAVEAVRALAGDAVGRGAIAAALPAHASKLEAGDAREAQVVIEAERQLQAYGREPAVEAALGSLVHAAQSPRVPPLARGWIACLAIAAAQRAASPPSYAAVEQCGGGELPDHLRLPLVADLITAGTGDVAARREALRLLLAHADSRVRAAGLGALAALWPDGDDADHRTSVQTLAAALGSSDVVLAGAAAEAAPALYDALAKTPGDTADRAALDAAVVARATREREPELAASLDELIGKQQIAAGTDACRAGLAGAPVQARAAAECLRVLGAAVPPPAIGPASPPPVDVAAVIGHAITWHLVTTRGEIVLALRPDVAPWNVATIVALTRRGFYDGLEFHRVVPGFVVQGGDPTGSGEGGPGFTTPAEPAGPDDDAVFATGAAGIADAGRDSGGSQFFLMHARAPHLDGRYTWIGAVTTGQDVVDALLIGDRIIRATVEIR